MTQVFGFEMFFCVICLYVSNVILKAWVFIFSLTTDQMLFHKSWGIYKSDRICHASNQNVQCQAFLSRIAGTGPDIQYFPSQLSLWMSARIVDVVVNVSAWQCKFTWHSLCYYPCSVHNICMSNTKLTLKEWTWLLF